MQTSNDKCIALYVHRKQESVSLRDPRFLLSHTIISLLKINDPQLNGIVIGRVSCNLKN